MYFWNFMISTAHAYIHANKESAYMTWYSNFSDSTPFEGENESWILFVEEFVYFVWPIGWWICWQRMFTTYSLNFSEYAVKLQSIPSLDEKVRHFYNIPIWGFDFPWFFSSFQFLNKSVSWNFSNVTILSRIN